MITPLRILALLAIVFGLSGLFMAVVPEDGMMLGPVHIQYPTWDDYLHDDPGQKGMNLEELFEIYAQKNGPEIAKSDSLARIRAHQLAMKRFQFPQGDSCVLDAFFTTCALATPIRRVRILHYGDSQIEGNRITGLLNNWFQSNYGGRGPGWIPVVEIIPTDAADQDQSDNWIRYTRYGGGPTSGHDRYGLLGAFSRFTPSPFHPDTSTSTSKTVPLKPTHDTTYIRPSAHKAWFSIGPRRGINGRYDQVRLAIGDLQDTLYYSVRSEQQLIDTGAWVPRPNMLTQTWKIGYPPSALRFQFRSKGSPNFYGASLESDQGIYVDNIALRGSSGTEFTRINRESIRAQVGNDQVAMVIYQFGGNTLPNTTRAEQVDYYRRVVIAQLARIRQLFPDAVLLVIGPSDMSIKDKDQLVTHPFLPALRDVMKEAAFDQHAVFWDMYEAMGGRNSMVQWVDADPALATTDYTHFTYEGTKVIAEWLIQAFEESRTSIQAPVQ
ncbi:MAG: hypothetical protein K9I85_09275 [Saprospiraceae bacterium]|nr:hypothetical protein [Saprospiraceae bacterium]